MAIRSYLTPWHGITYRHLPLSMTDPLDFRLAGQGIGNRWNRAGEPTLYLASDVDVALVEYGRHLGSGFAPTVSANTRRRALFRYEVQVDRLLDLRDLRTCDALYGVTDPHWYFDRVRAQSVAADVRREHATQGIMVRSIGFPETGHEDMFTLVLFLENMPPDPTTYVLSVQKVAVFRLEVVSGTKQ